ncbi:C-type lectin domain family 4 member E [Channa argus]|uniref:C-type lectin domain family 4 member E n=1 Tax=Channa argus TaxID=215402 RepID=A0A6G1PPE6_CHAAH|nr:C-type lectin domain family 4 member E [Channa argus]
MEMQEIPPEKEEKKEDEGASESALKVKTEEEAEPEHYTKLRAPSENIYSESLYSGGPLIKKEGNQTPGIGRLYRAGCFFLTVICLVLVLVVIILSVKLQNGSTGCPEKQEKAKADSGTRSLTPDCSYEQCQAHHFIQPKHLGCQQCAKGWLTFGRSCFYLSTFRLSWEESQRNCTSRGGSLAIINSQSVQTFLTKVGRLSYWIGLRYNRDRWAWVNQTVLQRSYWAEHETAGDCGILSSGDPPEKNWSKASCQFYSYFICQLQY